MSFKVSASVSHQLFNDSIEKSEFPQNVKLAELHQSRRTILSIKQFIDLLAYYALYQQFSKE